MSKSSKDIEDFDPTASERKKDHIELAFRSQVKAQEIDARFYYEPILSGHPSDKIVPDTKLLGGKFSYPIWVSSMTGGTQHASTINRNLAKACAKYGLGMGLGSCRSLLNSDDNLADFEVRKFIGKQPLYANLGIAQVEDLVHQNRIDKIRELLDKLSADGLIIHINPLQEWTQPEGDRYFSPPIDTIKRLLDSLDAKIIVKEVGQGMGKSSLRALLSLPLQAVDFAANGGTNFSKLELYRGSDLRAEVLGPIVNVGHSAKEMLWMTNQLLGEMGENIKCREVIISGGIKTFLDGYYLISQSRLPAVYGQASGFLKHSRGSFEELDEYVHLQIEGLKVAYAFLKLKEESN